MPETYTILTPLPQLNLEKKIPWPDRKANSLPAVSFCFSPKTPRLYRSLANLAKEQKCSDNVILLLQGAQAVFGVEIPHPWPIKGSPIGSAAIYTTVGDAILRRLFDCLLLFEYVPKPFWRSFWILTSGPVQKLDTKSLQLLEPNWDYYEPDIKYSEPVQANMMILSLYTYWSRLSPILRIKQLKNTFNDKNKQKGYVAAGNANTKRKAEELATSAYEERGEAIPIKIGKELGGKWFFEGYHGAYLREIAKLDRKLYKGASGQRFIRAFQLFTNACRLENPHRFVAVMSSLETLFCTTSKEITFQLASRIAWFLTPNNFDKRKKLFANVKDLYGIRSKIVHGGKYSIDKIEHAINDLEDLVRSVFSKILSNEKVYNLFFNKDQNLCNEYLDGLNLGES